MAARIGDPQAFFRAYAERASRLVVKFEVRPLEGLAQAQ